MSDVAILSVPEDRSRAEQIARLLADEGVAAVVGADPRASTQILVWSSNSSTPTEAEQKAEIVVTFDGVAPMLASAAIIDFTAWDGGAHDRAWRKLRQAMEGVSAQARRTPTPVPSAQRHAAFAGAHAPHTPIDYVLKCLRLYANGSGRARRSEFWWFTVFVSLVIVVSFAADWLIFDLSPATSFPVWAPLSLVAVLLLVSPFVSVSARRLHDVSLSGWLAALGLVPYLGWLFLAVIGFIPGHAQENAHGFNPKAAE